MTGVRRIPFSILFSLLIHAALLFGLNELNDQNYSATQNKGQHKFKISKISSVTPVKLANLAPKLEPVKPSPKTKPQPKQKEVNKDITLSDLAAGFDTVSTKMAAANKKTTPEPGIRQQQFKVTKIEKGKVEQSLRMSKADLIPDSIKSQLQNAFSGIQIDREDKNEDELNQDELVFYSFFNRVGEAYIHAFMEEITAYQKRYPSKKYSLPFPDEETQVMAEITYDENGDILRIQTIRWSDVGYFQDFFMNVMKALDNLPNPPKELIKSDGTFSIKYSLQIKI